jgi:hypothetical protein
MGGCKFVDYRKDCRDALGTFGRRVSRVRVRYRAALLVPVFVV